MRHLDWGDHLCHLYESSTDLSEVLIPYFKWGLEHNQACLWIAGSPYGKDRGQSELRSAVPEFDKRKSSGQIQILDFEEWYAKYGNLGIADVVQVWMSRKDDALKAGYAGLRITGNASFLDESTWDDFQKYEQMADTAFHGQPIISLCSYCQDQCTAQGLQDLMQSHDFALKKTFGVWHPCEPCGNLDATDRHSKSSSDVRNIVSVILDAHTTHASIEGPELWVSRAQAITLQMIFHQLARNAMQNGAFTSRKRSLLVTWAVVMNGSQRLCVRWIETGAPGLFIDESVDPSVILIATLASNFKRAFTPTGREFSFELDLDNRYV
jgi:MEDS: MEthanogen/methylotroph, DcmR Sensory domain